MIFEGSRYETATVAFVLGSDGKYHATVFPSADPPSESYNVVVTTAGMRFDILAGLVYGDDELWWRIAEQNPEIFYPDDIPVGTSVKIPSATTVS